MLLVKNFENGYANVNGLNMYYEIYGEGKPLILIHGGGSTIQTTFGNIIPLLAKHRQLIGMDLQAHGRTGDRDTDLTFQQDADDVAALLKHLGISKGDFLGFSNGGHTAIEISLRHPQLINKIIIASSFYKRNAAPDEFWKGFDDATIDMMPQALKEGYLKANHSEAGLLNMFTKDVKKMKAFKDWTDKQIQSIKAPALIINGTQDVGSIEHAVAMYHMLPNSELCILPGGHGTYMGTIESYDAVKFEKFNALGVIEEFLNR